MLKRVGKFARTRENAEDLLQTALLRLEEYRSRHTVQDPTGFVLRAARNIAIDEHRRSVVRNEVDTSLTDVTEVPDDKPLQIEKVAAYERLWRAKQGIALLNPRTRDVFLMHRLDGFTYRDIAEKLDISVSAVEKHLAKAVLQLADYMEGAQ